MPALAHALSSNSGRLATVVAQCGSDHRARHLFTPCLHRHSNGQLLVVARWDEHGTEEGDATNEQALYFSGDGGASWTLAGDGPILTYAHGSSFSQPSSLTHAWIFEDRSGRTWLYYTINQPFTWGEGRASRSTGGGEIRKQEVAWTGTDWVARGTSVVVWGFQQPLPDGRGGWCHDVRVVSWNGVVRQADGSLVMPVGGRSTVADPRGTFSKLDRVWVLISRDDGASWREAYFVGGGERLCLAEPSVVTTSRPGELVGFFRVQYNTGDQLHRAASSDGGRTWSAPQPTGLPQANTQGVKPYVLRLADGRYALIQTNEHDVIERTNLAIFLTDEAGLRADRWPQLRTLHVGNRLGWWPGSCYGWLAQDADGALLAAFPVHDTLGGRLCFTRVPLKDFAQRAQVEPNGVHDELGDHVPRRDGPPTPRGESSWHFADTRGRLVAADYGVHGGAVAFALRIEQMPAVPFRVARFTARNGRDEAGTLLLDSSGWSWKSAPWPARLALPVPAIGAWTQLQLSPSGSSLKIDVGGRTAVVSLALAPTGLQCGGATAPAPAGLFLGDFAFLPA